MAPLMGAGLQQLPTAELDGLARVHETNLRRIRELQVPQTHDVTQSIEIGFVSPIRSLHPT